MNNFKALDLGKKVLEIEIKALKEVVERLGEEFNKCIEILLHLKGRVVVVGMGKSGLVGRKIAATFSSTGTPAIFLHAAEAIHGDMGVVMKNDAILALSYRGETQEVLDVLPRARILGIPVISLVGRRESTLAQNSDLVLDMTIAREACPFDLAPTASTTVMLALGDALAITLLELKGFKSEDFACLHPAGSLGKKLLLRIDDLMHKGEENPVISQNETLRSAVMELASKRLGAVSIVDEDNKLVGLISDGDLKRLLLNFSNPLDLAITEVMTKSPTTIASGKLAADAVHIMEDRPSQIAVLPVVDQNGCPVGMVRLHDLIKAGLM